MNSKEMRVEVGRKMEVEVMIILSNHSHTICCIYSTVF